MACFGLWNFEEASGGGEEAGSGTQQPGAAAAYDAVVRRCVQTADLSGLFLVVMSLAVCAALYLMRLMQSGVTL